jgi:hypothetical protein
MPEIGSILLGAVGSSGAICGDRWLKMEKKGVKWGMSLLYTLT